MADILSQAEIDELLAQLNNPEGADTQKDDEQKKDQFRLHDFRTANKFSRDQMRTLHGVFENFAYMLSTRMTGLLRAVCEVKIISIEEITFIEYSNAMSANPSVFAVLEATPLLGSFLMQISLPTAYAMVVRMLGGVAEHMEVEKKLTEIEITIVESVLENFMDVISTAWKKVTDIRPSIEKLETSSQFAMIAANNEPTATITLLVRIDSVEEVMSFCLPHYVLQPIAKQLSTLSWNLAENAPRGVYEPQDKNISRRLDTTYINLTAQFKETEIRLEDLLWLKVGDVLCLDHPVDEYLDIYVENIRKFEGIVGVNGNRKVVQIADIVKENKNGE